MYTTQTEQNEIGQIINDGAVRLFNYYVSKTGLEGYEFRDKQVATALGFRESKVKRLRNSLTKAYYFKKKTTTHHDGQPIISIFLGKEEIMNDRVYALLKYKKKTAVEAKKLLLASGNYKIPANIPATNKKSIQKGLDLLLAADMDRLVKGGLILKEPIEQDMPINNQLRGLNK